MNKFELLLILAWVWFAPVAYGQEAPEGIRPLILLEKPIDTVIPADVIFLNESNAAEQFLAKLENHPPRRLNLPGANRHAKSRVIIPNPGQKSIPKKRNRLGEPKYRSEHHTQHERVLLVIALRHFGYENGRGQHSDNRRTSNDCEVLRRKSVQVSARINNECLSHTNDCREDKRRYEQFPERELSQGPKNGDEAQQRVPGIGIRDRL